MDLSDALFSPSKALQQQAQAKDWIFVDSWLSKKYHPRGVPAFERNEETLQALMALVAFNERADEEQALVEKVERRALEELREKTHDPLDTKINQALLSTLPRPTLTALDTLATTTLALSAASPSPQTLALKTTHLTTTHFTLTQQLSALSSQQAILDRELSTLKNLLHDLQSETFTPPATLSKETSTWTRDAKTLSLKLDEYNERLAQYTHVAPPQPGVEDVARRQEELRGLKMRLRGVNERIEGYAGLPPDVGEARRVLDGLKGELRVLIERRNEGFEGLVENGGGGGRRSGGSRVPVRR